MPKPKPKSRTKTGKTKKENTIKILLLGDSGIGKSCSMIRFFQNEFFDSYITTIGVDFKKKDIILDNKQYEVYVWDTAGNERYRTITMTYLRGCHFLILFYDTTDIKSFDGLEDWIKTVQSYNGDISKLIIVGTKIDDVSNRKVSYEDALMFCSKYDINYYEISGKTGENVEFMFNEAIHLAYNPLKKVKDNCSFLKGCSIM
jgi:Ras-related protein Rab-1A